MAEAAPQAKKEEAAPAPGASKEAPVAKLPGSPAFNKKGIIILAAVVIFEAVGFMLFLSRGSKGNAEAPLAKGESHEEDTGMANDEEFKKFKEVGRSILDLGEIKVPITSTQPRAPRSITANIQVVVMKEVLEKITEAAGGHGGGGKSNPQKDVLVLNIRSIVRSMMDSDGLRMVEPSAKADFERRAKDRLNHVQIDGDEEKAQVLKVLRGRVLQVVIDRFDSQSY
jgi:flagellar basal body-associated protein FliL